MLLKVFPDATVAVTHRDPVAVIQSSVTMLAYGQRLSHRKVETKALIDYWGDRVEHLLRACVRDHYIITVIRPTRSSAASARVEGRRAPGGSFPHRIAARSERYSWR